MSLTDSGVLKETHMNFHGVCLIHQLVKGELHHPETYFYVIPVRAMGRYLETR